jgi:UDP-2-acetamido-3-amino-2,3-dideoxy-glucuronate N-acetyltransferase
VGNEVTIKNGVAVWQYVTVEDRVFLGPNCSLTNDNRPRSKRPWTPVATTIREGATIGANATIVCGCHIGRYAFVGAGAVVTRPVPDYAVVVGNPGRVRGYVCECCQPLGGRGRELACKACGLRYVKTTHGVSRDEVPPRRNAKSGAPKPKAKARGVSPKPKAKARSVSPKPKAKADR